MLNTMFYKKTLDLILETELNGSIHKAMTSP